LWCLDSALAGINASASTTAVTTGTIIFIAILPAIVNQSLLVGLGRVKS
jgi:hypothetical protein